MSAASGSGVSGLRAVRVLRVLKMLKSWESLQSFLVVLLRTISELGNFCAVVFLVIFIFGLLGMQLFGGKFNFPEGVPRSNFDSFPWAMITVFQILTVRPLRPCMCSMINAHSQPRRLLVLPHNSASSATPNSAGKHLLLGCPGSHLNNNDNPSGQGSETMFPCCQV